MIAVVVIAYHEESSIGSCLVSLRQQHNFGCLRVVVVNNYAPDRTLIHILPFISQDIDVIVLSKNIGKTRAANIGFRFLQTRWPDDSFTYFVSIDGDIVLAKDALKEMATFLGHHSIVGLVAPRYYWYPAMTKLISLEEIMVEGEDHKVKSNIAGWTAMSHTLEGCFMMPQRVYEALVKRHGGLFIEMPMIYTHTGLFMPLLSRFGYKLGYLDSAHVYQAKPTDQAYEHWKRQQWLLRKTPEQQSKIGYLELDADRSDLVKEKS